MPAPDLPRKDSPGIRLAIASPEELLEQQKANSVEWRGVLPTTEAYLRREDVLAAEELTKDGGLTAWMLVYDLQQGARTVLCGCESVRKRALIAKDGAVTDTIAHGIASVFCPPANRGHGYAGRMMGDLAVKLKDWQATEGSTAGFSVLYSDIGKGFYAARGWKAFPSAHVSLPPNASFSTANLPGTRFLKKQEIPELCIADERTTRRRLAQLASPGKTTVALLPDANTVNWHFAKEDFVTNEIFQRIPEERGAIVEDASGTRAWCYWTRVYTNPQEDAPNTLHILRLAIEDESFTDFAAATENQTKTAGDGPIVRAVAALLQAAQRAAEQWDMKEVQIWNPSSTTLAAARLLQPGSAVVHREKESIASLLWYGDDEDVDWMCNEKFGWC